MAVVACRLVNEPDEGRVISHRLLARPSQGDLFPFSDGLLHAHSKLRAAVEHPIQLGDRRLAGNPRDVEVERQNVSDAEGAVEELLRDIDVVDLLKFGRAGSLQKEREFREVLCAFLHRPMVKYSLFRANSTFIFYNLIQFPKN